MKALSIVLLLLAASCASDPTRRYVQAREVQATAADVLVSFSQVKASASCLDRQQRMPAEPLHNTARSQSGVTA